MDNIYYNNPLTQLTFYHLFNHLTPMSDQEWISPYNINTISSRQVMRIKKILIRELLFDPTPNSPN